MGKIITLGEIMLRLSPNGQDRFIQTDVFRIIPGGGEANVAVSCANYGHDAYLVTKLPKHEIGQIAVNSLRRYGVNTKYIARGGDRVGLYYCETGASMRPSKVIYDRAHSAIAEADPSDFNFDEIMEDAELCLGFKPDANVEGGETNAAGYEGIFKQMKEEFGFKYVVSTLRESFSATFNGWKALIYDGKEFYQSKRYEINPIIDRVGGGDSFSGGLIHGLLTKPTQGEALEFAVAASALKHTINGDYNLVSEAEVASLAGGNASGRVQR